jgi:hypothetical protein
LQKSNRVLTTYRDKEEKEKLRIKKVKNLFLDMLNVKNRNVENYSKKIQRKIVSSDFRVNSRNTHLENLLERSPCFNSTFSTLNLCTDILQGKNIWTSPTHKNIQTISTKNDQNLETEINLSKVPYFTLEERKNMFTNKLLNSSKNQARNQLFSSSGIPRRKSSSNIVLGLHYDYSQGIKVIKTQKRESVRSIVNANKILKELY